VKPKQERGVMRAWRTMGNSGDSPTAGTDGATA
jgi:hypothetical protein